MDNQTLPENIPFFDQPLIRSIPSITLRVEWWGKSYSLISTSSSDDTKTSINVVEFTFKNTDKFIAPLPEKGVNTNEKVHLPFKTYKESTYHEYLEIDIEQMRTMSLVIGRFIEFPNKKHSNLKRENEKIALHLPQNIENQKNYKIVINSHDQMTGFTASFIEDI